MSLLIVLLILSIILAVKGIARFLVRQLGDQPPAKKLNVDITWRFLQFLCAVMVVILAWALFRLAHYSAWPTTEQFCQIHCLSPVGAYALYLTFALTSAEVLVIALPYFWRNPTPLAKKK